MGEHRGQAYLNALRQYGVIHCEEGAVLTMPVNGIAPPVDVVPGRVELSTVCTSGFPSPYGSLLIISPKTPSSNMTQDFGFLFAKLRQQFMDNDLIYFTYTPMICT